MKRNHLLILLALLLLAACSPASGYVCDDGLCIRGEIETASLGEPATWIITVKSDRDVDGLLVSISHAGWRAPITIKEVPESAQLTDLNDLGCYWSMKAEAGRQYTFTGEIELPPPNSPSGIHRYSFWFSADHYDAHVIHAPLLYQDAEGNRLDPEEARSRSGEDPILPTIHPSISPIIPTPYPTINWPTATPEPPTPTPTVDPYPAPENGRGAEPTAAPYPAP